MAIKEKSSKQAIKEVVDNKKDRTSTKILIGVAIAIITTIIFTSVKQLLICKLNSCSLAGMGIGSVIVVLIWLGENSLKS